MASTLDPARGSIHGLWLDRDGSIYTAEAGFNNRLQKLARVQAVRLAAGERSPL